MRLPILCFLFSLSAFAGPVTVSCTGADPVYTNNGFTGSCHGLTQPYGGLNGASSVDLSFDISHDLVSGFYSLSEAISDFNYSGMVEGNHGSGIEAFLDYRQTFNSGGPVRPGFLEIENLGGVLRSYNGGQYLTMGFPNGSLAGVDPDVFTQSECDISAGCGRSAVYYSTQHLAAYPIPILLGTDMTLFASSSLLDYADLISGISGGEGNAEFRFRLTEANGAPVTLIPTPEPAVIGLATGGGLLIYLLRRRRQLPS